jgi:hypothetical protein
VYVLFVEQAFRSIRTNGFICFIHPHRFLTADYGRGIKAYLDKVHGLRSAILFGVDQVFAAATTYTGVFCYSQGNALFRFKHATTADFAAVPFAERKYSSSGAHWTLSTGDNSSSALIEKLRTQACRLLDICRGVYQGIVTVGDDIFVLRGCRTGKVFVGWSEAAGADIELEAEIVKPLRKGEHIRRYEAPISDLVILYPHFQDAEGRTQPFSESELRQRFPRALSYLKPFKSHLIEKKVAYKTNPKFWYSLHRARDMSLFEQKKLLTPQLQNQPSFTLERSRWYPDAGGYSLILKDPTEVDYRFLLGIMNSSVLWYFIRSTSNPYRNNYYYFKTKYLEPFSIPFADKASRGRVADLVEAITHAKHECTGADTSKLEREVDHLVFRLYGLTDDEIEIVERARPGPANSSAAEGSSRPFP